MPLIRRRSRARATQRESKPEDAMEVDGNRKRATAEDSRHEGASFVDARAKFARAAREDATPEAATWKDGICESPMWTEDPICELPMLT